MSAPQPRRQPPVQTAPDGVLQTPSAAAERLNANPYARAVLALQEGGHAGESMAEAINRQPPAPAEELVSTVQRLRAALAEAEQALRVHEANLAAHGDNLPDGWNHRATRDVAGAADLAAITLRRAARP